MAPVRLSGSMTATDDHASDGHRHDDDPGGDGHDGAGAAHDHDRDHDHHDHGHDDHGHDDHGHHDHGHHGHHHDRGWAGIVRYLRNAPRMWRSPVNDAVVALVAPERGEVVVDIGAGMGAGVVRVAATGAHVIAVEPTPFMRRTLAVRRLAQRGRKRIEIADGAAEDLPVADAGAAAIYAVNTMHHWVDVDRGVAEIARALAPSGRLLLVDEAFDDPAHPDHERFASHGHTHPFTMVTADAMAERLRAAGLVDVDPGLTHIAGRPVTAVTARAPSTS